MRWMVLVVVVLAQVAAAQSTTPAANDFRDKHKVEQLTPKEIQELKKADDLEAQAAGLRREVKAAHGQSEGYRGNVLACGWNTTVELFGGKYALITEHYDSCMTW